MTKARTKGQARRAPKTHAQAAEATLQPQIEGPTIHAAQHGRYARSATPRAPYVNSASTYLGRLEVNGSITTRQRKGGEAFADTYRLTWGVSGRDSTIPPVGGMSHETQSEAERTIARKAKLNAVLNNVASPAAYVTLVNVAVFELTLGRNRGPAAYEYDKLEDALDACVVVFDVPA